MFVQTAFIPYYLGTDINSVCVLCISSSITAARRQTAPPHHTHNFCWHGPCQRSHDEMPFLYLPFYFFAATTTCLYKRHLFPTTSAQIYRLRMCTMYQWFYCCCCLSFFPSISLALFKGIPHTTISPFLYLPFYFSQLQQGVCTNGIHSLLPFWHVLLFDL